MAEKMDNSYARRMIGIIVFSFFCIGTFFLSEVTRKASAAEDVPHQWATPIECKGLPNLHKVSDDYYRGAQPTAEGMQELKRIGIKTVINLRAFHSDHDELGDLDLAYEHIPMVAWHPEEEDITRFLKIVTAKNRTPVFIHCQHGADRTGVMSAIYRIVVEDWTKEEATKEMTEGGFGFHKIWKNLITFVKNLDIEAIKKQAGIAEQITQPQ